MKRLIIIALIVLGACIGDTYGKNVLMIVNKLTKNKVLMVHCFSGNDNLGVQYLHFNEKSPAWRFNNAYFHETLFACTLKYGRHYEHHRGFTAYKSSWSSSSKNNANATWFAADRGIYLSFNHQTPQFQFTWL